MAAPRYIFAGLDFVFDSLGIPWFIEANGSPHGMRNFEIVSGPVLAPKVAAYMKSKGANPCIVISRSDRFSEKKETGVWVYRRLKRELPGLRLCYSDANRHRRKLLVDSEGREFVPGCILRYGEKLSPALERSCPMINATAIRYITMDKMFTAEIARRVRGAHVPLSFIVRSRKDAERRIRENAKAFSDGFVLKPNFESLGYGIKVFDSGAKVPEIRRPVILQQRIIPKLRKGRYWDLRILLFNGKLVGGEVRVSESAVTNAALGSSVEKAPQDVLSAVSSASEAIVRAIDREAVRISGSPELFRNLKRRTPKTVKNK